MVQHGDELDYNQESEGQDEHESHRIDEDVVSGELQVEVNFWHLDEDGRLDKLESEGCQEPEGVENEEDEGNL